MANATPLDDVDADQLIAGIREWVSYETPPHDEPRLRAFAELAADQAGRAGLRTALIPVGPSKLPLLQIVAESATPAKPVLILAHYDTVHPVGTVERNRLRIEDGRMYGPGTYDMKAGGYL